MNRSRPSSGSHPQNLGLPSRAAPIASPAEEAGAVQGRSTASLKWRLFRLSARPVRRLRDRAPRHRGPRAGHRVPTLGDGIDVENLAVPGSPRCASALGINVHANVCVPARDRLRLEMLCRTRSKAPSLGTRSPVQPRPLPQSPRPGGPLGRALRPLPHRRSSSASPCGHGRHRLLPRAPRPAGR